MADNKLLLRRNSDEHFFEEGDPLAELARIVGFEPRADVKPPAMQARREPEFDLEDELLKEFEHYGSADDAYPAMPVASPSHAVDVEPAKTSAAAVNEIVPPVSLAAAPLVQARPPEPAAVPRPQAAVKLHQVVADASPVPMAPAGRPDHPVFNLEDEITREFATFDARRVRGGDRDAAPVAAEIVRQEPVFAEVSSSEPAMVQEAVEAPPLAAMRTEPIELYDAPDLDVRRAARSAPVSDYVPVEQTDSYQGVPVRDEDVWSAEGPQADNAYLPVSSGDEAIRSQDAADPLDLDLGDDAAYWAELTAQAEAERPVRDVAPVTSERQAPVVSSSYRSERMESLAGLDLAQPPIAAAPVETVARQSTPTPFVQPEVVSTPTSTPADSKVAARFDLDPLLDDVERYPVVEPAARWGIHSKPLDASDVRPAPVVVPEHEHRAPAVQEALRDPSPPAPVVADHPASAVSATQADLAFEDIGFDEASFELELGDIELDLSDFADIEPQVTEASIADRAAAEVPVAQSAWAPAAPREAVDYSTLPFDPSQVTSEEEPLEVLAEMDVPEMPVVQDEEKPVQHAEYDIDIDADMAQLFAAAGNQPAEFVQNGATLVPPPQISDLDEFERALEEDFRRSFAENRNPGVPDRVPLAPSYQAPDVQPNRRGMALLGVSALAIALFGGAGVYAFMSGDTAILSSSEPKIILADTTPVKVVPEDRGGKQVPNQNKAVYDRVSGENVDLAKQESLVSSSEEPVDVVQRTLMPENLPMDDESMAMATPTGDTVDPRLLPEEAEHDRVTTTSKVVSGVSPRKVKTMVVRPDGSLVAREDTDTGRQAATDAELLKIAQKAAQDAATAAETSGDDIAKAIGDVPERLAPSDGTPAEVDVPASRVQPAPVESQDNSALSLPQDKVASADPVAEMAAADTGQITTSELKPATPADASQSAERSLTVPASDETPLSPVAADSEVEDAPVRKVKTTTITPVPESRPADQPVNVVGTVSDQGRVQAPAESQQVASVDTTNTAPLEQAALPVGSYVIQIASLPSEGEAKSSYAKLSSKFASVIGGRGVDIRRAEIKNKGTYYRVRIPAGSKQEAQDLCSQYKQAGGSCLVSK